MTDVEPEAYETLDERSEMGPLLRDLARHDGVSGEALDRLRARLASSLPDVGLDAPERPAEAPVSAPPPSPSISTGAGAVTSGKLLFAVYGLAVGAVLGGFAVHAYEGRSPNIGSPVSAPSHSPSATTTDVPRSVAPQELGPPAIVEPTAHSSTGPRPHPSAESSPSSAAKASPSSTLNAERLMVDVARSAYAKGDLDEALRSLARHATTYPEGALAEEREALAIRILVDAKHTSEARSRGQRFRTRYPKSLMLPAVEAALESIP
jgi:hypothetical protein